MAFSGTQSNIDLLQQQNSIISIQAQLTHLRLARARIAAVISSSSDASTTFNSAQGTQSSSTSSPVKLQPTASSRVADSTSSCGVSESTLGRAVSSKHDAGTSAALESMANSSLTDDSSNVLELGKKLDRLKNIRERRGNLPVPLASILASLKLQCVK